MIYIPLKKLLADARPGFACGEVDEIGLAQIRMNNVSTDGTLSFDKLRRVPESYRQKAPLLLPDDVIFNATNSPELVGKSGLFRGFDEPITFSNHFLRLRTNPEKLDGSYLARWLNLQWQKGIFQRICRQWVNQATVASDRLLSLEIPVLTLPEQRRIAAILDQAEALRAKRRQALAKLDELGRSIFLEMFGSLPLDTTLGKECVFSQGIQIPVEDQKNEAQDGYVRFLRIIDYTQTDDPRYIKHPGERYCIDEADVVMVRYGASAGFAGIGKAGALANNLFKFNFDKNLIRPLYLYFCLKTQRFDSFIKKKAFGAAMPALSFGIMNEYLISVPPIGMQDQFVTTVENVEALKSRYLQSLAKLDALFASLQHRAFRGEL